MCDDPFAHLLDIPAPPIKLEYDPDPDGYYKSYHTAFGTGQLSALEERRQAKAEQLKQRAVYGLSVKPRVQLKPTSSRGFFRELPQAQGPRTKDGSKATMERGRVVYPIHMNAPGKLKIPVDGRDVEPMLYTLFPDNCSIEGCFCNNAFGPSHKVVVDRDITAAETYTKRDGTKGTRQRRVEYLYYDAERKLSHAEIQERQKEVDERKREWLERRDKERRTGVLPSPTKREPRVKEEETPVGSLWGDSVNAGMKMPNRVSPSTSNSSSTDPDEKWFPPVLETETLQIQRRPRRPPGDPMAITSLLCNEGIDYTKIADAFVPAPPSSPLQLSPGAAANTLPTPPLSGDPTQASFNEASSSAVSLEDMPARRSSTPTRRTRPSPPQDNGHHSASRSPSPGPSSSPSDDDEDGDLRNATLEATNIMDIDHSPDVVENALPTTNHSTIATSTQQMQPRGKASMPSTLTIPVAMDVDPRRALTPRPMSVAPTTRISASTPTMDYTLSGPLPFNYHQDASSTSQTNSSSSSSGSLAQAVQPSASTSASVAASSSSDTPAFLAPVAQRSQLQRPMSWLTPTSQASGSSGESPWPRNMMMISSPSPSTRTASSLPYFLTSATATPPRAPTANMSSTTMPTSMAHTPGSMTMHSGASPHLPFSPNFFQPSPYYDSPYLQTMPMDPSPHMLLQPEMPGSASPMAYWNQAPGASNSSTSPLTSFAGSSSSPASQVETGSSRSSIGLSSSLSPRSDASLPRSRRAKQLAAKASASPPELESNNALPDSAQPEAGPSTLPPPPPAKPKKLRAKPGPKSPKGGGPGDSASGPSTKKEKDPKPHPCPVPGCKARFTRANDVKRHMASASAHRDFKLEDELKKYVQNDKACPRCGRILSREDSARRHYESGACGKRQLPSEQAIEGKRGRGVSRLYTPKEEDEDEEEEKEGGSGSRDRSKSRKR